MKFYLPSYDECLTIVKSNPHGCFYERGHVVDDYEISIFSYRNAKHNNFMMPLQNEQVNALEMKGLVFVFNDDKTVYKRYLMLHKFWEIDQYEHCMKDLYKDIPVKNITVKEDGFLVSFIRLPNSVIVSNTKNGFYDDINVMANEFLQNKDYFNFISSCLDKDIRPIFELVIPNRKFVKYNETSLILTKLRCNVTGKYLDLDGITEVPVVDRFKMSLDEVYRIKDHVRDLEGWVVHFIDDSIIKVKTKFWRDLKDEY